MFKVICVLTLLIYCLYPNRSYAQDQDSIIISRIKFGDTDKQVMQARNELNQQEIDTIVCYYVDCIGSVTFVKPDSCNSPITKYLIWKDHGKAYIRKFNGCQISAPRKVSPVFLNTLYSRVTEFKLAKIRHPQYSEVINGKKQTLLVVRDHTCIDKIEVSTPTGQITNELDDFAIDTKYLENGKRNINYMRNQRSFLNKLKTMLESLVKIS